MAYEATNHRGIRARVHADGSRTYEVQVRLRGFPTETATFARLTDARAWKTATEAALREGRHFPHRKAQRRTLAELIDAYLEQGNREYRTQLEWWKGRLGAHRLSDVTPERIAEAKRELATGLTRRGEVRSSATTNRYLAALSVIFTHGRRELRWVQSNPLQSVSRLREPQGRTRFLSPSERAALLRACRPGSDLHDLVTLALATGARAGELLGLSWSDVDLERRRAIARDTKNGDTRAIPLAAPALDVLRHRFEHRNSCAELVFPNAYARRHDWYGDPFRAALKAAGIENFRFHDLRHCAATYLLESGATLAELAGILGHKTLAMVRRYAHVSNEHAGTVVERMAARVFTDDVAAHASNGAAVPVDARQHP